MWRNLNPLITVSGNVKQWGSSRNSSKNFKIVLSNDPSVSLGDISKRTETRIPNRYLLTYAPYKIIHNNQGVKQHKCPLGESRENAAYTYDIVFILKTDPVIYHNANDP